MMTKRILSGILLTVLPVFFSACQSTVPTKQYILDQTPLSGYYDPAGYDVSNCFLGELPSVPEDMPTLTLSINEKSCTYEDRSYQKMTTSPNADVACWSGWQLDCSYLQSLGKTDEGFFVYGIIKNNKTQSLLLANHEEKIAQWFVLDDLPSIDVYSLSTNDFQAQKLYGPTDTKNELSTIWEHHTSKEYKTSQEYLLEWPEYHAFYLVSKKSPWLVYELTYCYEFEGSSSLYFYNADIDGWIFLRES